MRQGRKGEPAIRRFSRIHVTRGRGSGQHFVTPTSRRSEMRNEHAVYVQTNDANGNRVIAFARAADGTLSPSGDYATGGAGDGVAHLTSQGSVVLTGDGGHLLVTNAGSDSLSVFAVTSDGLELVQAVPTGEAPKSGAERDRLVYVLNTGVPSVTGFRLEQNGLVPLADSSRELGSDADPAQLGFSPDGSTLG